MSQDASPVGSSSSEVPGSVSDQPAVVSEDVAAPQAEAAATAASSQASSGDRFSVDDNGFIVDSAAGGRHANFGVDPTNEDSMRRLRELVAIFNFDEMEAAKFGWNEGPPPARA